MGRARIFPNVHDDSYVHKPKTCKECSKIVAWKIESEAAPPGETIHIPENTGKCQYTAELIKKYVITLSQDTQKKISNQVGLDIMKKLAELSEGHPSEEFCNPEKERHLSQEVKNVSQKKQYGVLDQKKPNFHQKENSVKQYEHGTRRTEARPPPSVNNWVGDESYLSEFNHMQYALDNTVNGTEYVTIVEESFRLTLNSLKYIHKSNYKTQKEGLIMFAEECLQLMLLEFCVPHYQLSRMFFLNRKIPELILRAAEENCIHAKFLAVFVKLRMKDNSKLDNIDPLKIIEEIKESDELTHEVKEDMCSVLYCAKYLNDSQIGCANYVDLVTAFQMNPLNIDAKFKYGEALIISAMHGRKTVRDRKTIMDVLRKFSDAEEILKECIRDSYFDSLTVRDAHYYRAMMYLAVQNDYEALKCFKQGDFANARIPSCIKAFTSRETNVPPFVIARLRKKFPLISSLACDECDKEEEDDEFLICPCNQGFYCDEKCRQKSWYLHKDTCATMITQNKMYSLHYGQMSPRKLKASIRDRRTS